MNMGRVGYNAKFYLTMFQPQMFMLLKRMNINNPTQQQKEKA